MLNIDFICPLPNGLHARPAYDLKEQCCRFDSQVALVNHRLGQTVDAKSMLALVSSGTLFNDACSLRISGGDEEKACRALKHYLATAFADSDSAPEPAPAPTAQPLPRSLTRFNPALVSGTALSPGIGHGILLHYRSTSLEVYSHQPGTRHDDMLLEHSLIALAERLSGELNRLQGQGKIIITTHLSLIQDPGFARDILRRMERRKCGLARAVIENMNEICGKLAVSSSEYLRERVLDIQDITARLLHIAYPEVKVDAAICLSRDTVIAADNLTPSQFLGLDKALLKGMVLAGAGSTSHTLILARAFGVPVIAGIDTAGVRAYEGQEVFVDGHCGVLVTRPDEGVRGHYRIARRLDEQRRRRQLGMADTPALTRDGEALEIGANIGTAHEAAAAFSCGADGIGLFRTEMLFMDRDVAPDEQEQFEAYRQVLMNAGPRPVIFRTIDIGGDKKISYLNIPPEENPFLGYRAVRIYPEFTDLFMAQLRAILRAAAFGYARLMIPMVHTRDEIIWVKTQIDAARQSLQNDGLRHAGGIELGIMVEVPSVSFIIDHFCEEVDFFSVGSNDMTQYLYAVDRNNPRVAHLYNPVTPAFLRMLRQVVSVARRHDRWVGLCGELGGEPRYVPLLLGLGLDEISMSGVQIPAIKEIIRQLSAADCRQLAAQACDCRSPREIEQLLDAFVLPAQQRPVLAVENILLPAELDNKEQVIQYLCGNLALHGRTDRPLELEEEIWQREELATTGIGFGFAIPHAKSATIKHAAISVARLTRPIDWQSEMGEVDFVIMLTVGDGQGISHIKIFSQLARKLMQVPFRDALRGAASADALLAFLQAELAL
ncbi:phosphoenolpyruvate--protein phosphotransferase [Sodalis sp. RH21]|uniref:phosphoenolpyruvate--protein phosphotransferase n=1 Tax=unclassified Sodalis (in: enterobacteria) TaxID=2636512 RepID=UPI0039B3B4D2